MKLRIEFGESEHRWARPIERVLPVRIDGNLNRCRFRFVRVHGQLGGMRSFDDVLARHSTSPNGLIPLPTNLFTRRGAQRRDSWKDRSWHCSGRRPASYLTGICDAAHCDDRALTFMGTWQSEPRVHRLGLLIRCHSLCRWQEKRMMREPRVQIGNSVYGGINGN